MYRFIYLILAFLAVLAFLYIPELLPQCSCCGRKKLRPFIRIHKAVGVNPGYKGNRSVCSKCCSKYDLKDLKDLDRFIKARKRARLDRLSKEL